MGKEVSWQEAWKSLKDSSGDPYGEYMTKVDNSKV